MPMDDSQCLFTRWGHQVPKRGLGASAMVQATKSPHAHSISADPSLTLETMNLPWPSSLRTVHGQRQHLKACWPAQCRVPRPHCPHAAEASRRCCPGTGSYWMMNVVLGQWWFYYNRAEIPSGILACQSQNSKLWFKNKNKIKIK